MGMAHIYRRMSTQNDCRVSLPDCGLEFRHARDSRSKTIGSGKAAVVDNKDKKRPARGGTKR